MSQPTKPSLLATMAAIFLLAACAPAQPTQNPEDIANQVATAVALTVAAQNAQTQAALPLLPEATNTTLPTQIPEAIDIVTDTPTGSDEIIIVTDTPIPIPTDVEPITVTPRAYSCDAFAQSPDYQAEFKPGDEFDIRWIIINTGTRPWPAGFDVKYSSGSKMTSVTVVEIPIEMKTNDRYTIVLDAVAPKHDGPQYMPWIVQGQLCYPSVIINVVK